jgi:RNA polymerase sigma-70 factor (family 1)
MQVILNETFDWAVLKDELVFKDVYRQYFVKLYRFAFSIVHSKEAAEEIVHDVLINLWKKRDDFTAIANLNTYLYVSIKNLSLNYIRNEAKHRHLDIDSLYDECSYISIDPESLLITKEQAADLNTLINKLPVRCKMIFKLVKIDGLRYKEVANLLNISVKTVENQLIIAVKKITEALRPPKQ